MRKQKNIMSTTDDRMPGDVISILPTTALGNVGGGAGGAIIGSSSSSGSTTTTTSSGTKKSSSTKYRVQE